MKAVKLQTKLLLGFQHVLAMFGATVLVPFLTGLDPSIALVAAGIGTLIFHYFTKKIVPVFLGSSFAFIGAISFILKQEGIAAVKGGIIVAGLVYILMAILVKIFGVEKIKSFFPPVVVGPVIMIIGLRMSHVALNMVGYKDSTFDLNGLIVAIVVIATMIVVSILERSFFRLVPILISVVVGYIVASMLGMVDLSGLSNAKWIGLSDASLDSLLVAPEFSSSAILAIAPIALVVFIEHIGDITTNGAVVGKDFFENPGVSRTLLGDGLATAFAGLIGGPANTTYGENTGVLAVTKVYDPMILRIAACYAIIMGLVGKFGVILQSIPVAVMGGISIILFGMISAVGIRTLINADIDFSHSRNLLIAAIIFVTGIAIDNVNLSDGLVVSGLTISAVIGVVLNKILPSDKLDEDTELEEK